MHHLTKKKSAKSTIPITAFLKQAHCIPPRALWVEESRPMDLMTSCDPAIPVNQAITSHKPYRFVYNGNTTFYSSARWSSSFVTENMQITNQGAVFIRPLCVFVFFAWSGRFCCNHRTHIPTHTGIPSASSAPARSAAAHLTR